MSATLESREYSQYFAVRLPSETTPTPAPVLSVDGRVWPVMEFYLDDLRALGEVRVHEREGERVKSIECVCLIGGGAGGREPESQLDPETNVQSSHQSLQPTGAGGPQVINTNSLSWFWEYLSLFLSPSSTSLSLFLSSLQLCKRRFFPWNCSLLLTRHA